MKEQNLNIKKVQESTTLSRTTISNLINHISTGIQYETLASLCELLKCQPGDLLVLHDFELQFKDEESSIIEISRDTEGTEDLLELTLSCDILLDNQKYKASFKTECNFWYNLSSTDLDIIDFKPSMKYEHFLKQNNFPYYIVEIINKRLENYIHDWIGNFVAFNEK